MCCAELCLPDPSVPGSPVLQGAQASFACIIVCRVGGVKKAVVFHFGWATAQVTFACCEQGSVSPSVGGEQRGSIVTAAQSVHPVTNPDGPIRVAADSDFRFFRIVDAHAAKEHSTRVRRGFACPQTPTCSWPGWVCTSHTTTSRNTGHRAAIKQPPGSINGMETRRGPVHLLSGLALQHPGALVLTTNLFNWCQHSPCQ